jgi:ABC-type lipoprotein release transport system permease subunit
LIFRLALRNLFRNRWRSALTVGGVVIAVMLLVWTLAYIEGFVGEMVRGATAVDIGQIKIQNPEYVERPSARHGFKLGTHLEDIRALPGVEAAAPRVRVYGLVGNEDTSGVAQIIGIDPELEGQVSVLDQGITQGKWLGKVVPDGPREAVIGERLATHIHAKLGDELVLFFEAADGSLGNDVLTIVGLIETGNTAIDRGAVYMNIADLQYDAALDDNVHEIVVKTTDILAADQIAAAMRPKLPGLAVRPWKEMVPEISQMIDVSQKSDLILFAMVYLIVAFGLFNAQRMSALERTREFGVILAIGVKPMQLFGTVLLETIFVTLLGALVGAGLGATISWYHTVYGLDLALFSDRANFDIMGISFSNRLYFSVSLNAVFKPVIYIVPVAVLCGIWPAWKAARLSAVEAISGRT